MEAKVVWQGHKMRFEGESRGLKTQMDSKPPFGDDSAPSPKELVLQGLCGCTAMDVLALLKKYKQTVTYLEVRVTTELTKEHPMVFTDLKLQYIIRGPEDPEKVKEAVSLSRNKYCGVIAMLEKNSKVDYEIVLS
ncbi:MAG: OsmC family protein [Bdellovibrionaceae bacterium]|nr:OsmC family protein [Pseudobdellovibrionaceae bacterium]MDW8190187.1 OsmC family protein [Pseudobdellovibrionaceae bacterium]